jgi:ABC-type transport system involved in multi-copper enzyme maturation permease subunit
MILVVTMTLRSIVRDRVLHALLVGASLIFALVPVFSLFSMRQTQELSITLALSGISFILLIFSVLYGASSIWRDIEKRYTSALLGLPLSRGSYLVGKFIGIALFLLGATAVLACASLGVISMGAAQYASDIPVSWWAVSIAILGNGLKYVLLMAIGLLLSSVSTSFFFPVFGVLAIYFAGSASQEVMEYISGEMGQQMSVVTQMTIRGVYWLIPNFSAFDFHVEAIYALPITVERLAVMLAYFAVYTAAVIALATLSFGKRELP